MICYSNYTTPTFDCQYQAINPQIKKCTKKQIISFKCNNKIILMIHCFLPPGYSFRLFDYCSFPATIFLLPHPACGRFRQDQGMGEA